MMKLSERRAREKAHKGKYRGAPSTNFKAAPKDWPGMFDIVFVGSDLDENRDPTPPSQVLAIAGRDGIEQLQRVFPGSHITWRPFDVFKTLASELPDWRECCVKVKDVITGDIDIPHKLPERLIALKPIDEISKEQLAFIMMSAVNDLGGRAAMLDEDLHILQVQMKHQPQFVAH